MTAVVMGFFTLLIIAALLLGIAGLYAWGLKHRSLGWRAVLLLTAVIDLILIVSMVQDYLGTIR